MSYDAKKLKLSELMQPELLTTSQLRNVLLSRCIRVDNIQNMNKEQLLDIFRRVATPLQQRAKFDNRKSSSADKSQTKLSKNNFPERSVSQNGKATAEATNDIKRMKISHEKSENTHNNKVQIKRSYNYDCKSEVPSNKKVRQRIPWP